MYLYPTVAISFEWLNAKMRDEIQFLKIDAIEQTHRKSNTIPNQYIERARAIFSSASSFIFIESIDFKMVNS